MEYRLPYRVRAIDYWRMTMRSIYFSYAGLVNLIFIGSMILVTYSLWNQVVTEWKIVLILLLSLFTIIQPLSIYLRSRQVIRKIPEETEIIINNTGIQVKNNAGRSKHKWSDIKKVVMTGSMCIVKTDNNNGIVLSYENMDAKKLEILDFVRNQVID